MSLILSRLKKLSQDVEMEADVVPAQPSGEEDEPTVSIDAEDSDAWLSADRSADHKKCDINDAVETHPVQYKKVPISSLVWAPFPSFKGGAVHVCARICDPSEGLLDSTVQFPIPDGHELVEFLQMPVRQCRLLSVPRWKIHQYNAVMKCGSHAGQRSLVDTVYQWSPSYLQAMNNRFRERYGNVKGKKVYDGVVSAAKKFLVLAAETAADEGVDDGGALMTEQSPMSSSSPKFDMDKLALKFIDEAAEINAGDTVFYDHKVFRDLGVISTRVTAVYGDNNVELENGDTLLETDLVKVVPCMEHKGSVPGFRQLSEYRFVVGTCNMIETLQQALHKGTAKSMKEVADETGYRLNESKNVSEKVASTRSPGLKQEREIVEISDSDETVGIVRNKKSKASETLGTASLPLERKRPRNS